MCITMAVVPHTPPNYSAAKKSLGVSPGPVVTESFTHLPFSAKVIFIYNAWDNVDVDLGQWSYEYGQDISTSMIYSHIV